MKGLFFSVALFLTQTAFGFTSFTCESTGKKAVHKRKRSDTRINLSAPKMFMAFQFAQKNQIINFFKPKRI